MGHVVRSLTLAEELVRRGHDVLLVGTGVIEGLKFADSFGIVPSRETIKDGGAEGATELLDFQPEGVAVDGYHFDKTFFAALADAKVPYAVIDDNGETQAPAPAVIINQNPSARKSLYPNVKLPTRFLLGQDFALIRSELRELASRPSSVGSHIAIGFGGTDPAGLSEPVAKHLLAQGHRIALHEKFRFSSIGLNHEEPEFFPSSSFINALSSASVAILGAGSSLWEAAALGVPTVAVVVAENQRKPSQAALDCGLIDALVSALDGRSKNEITHEVGQKVSLLLENRGRERKARIQLDGVERVASEVVASFEQYRAMIV